MDVASGGTMNCPESLIKSIDHWVRTCKLDIVAEAALKGIVEKAYKTGYDHGTENAPFIVPLKKTDAAI